MVLDNTKKMEVIIKRDENRNCRLIIPDLQNITINLYSSDTNEIESFFNSVFKWVIDNKKLVSFYTEDKEIDLYNEIAKELISQLNNEIKQSEKDFDAIIETLGINEEEFDI